MATDDENAAQLDKQISNENESVRSIGGERNHINMQQLPKFQPQPWCGQHLCNTEPLSATYTYSQLEQCKRKTPMCRIAELARLHKLKHEYKLMDESGPAHKKQFTVLLMLTPDEVYYGCGASIKKAQQAAAENALRETSLSLPPERNKSREKTRAMMLLRYVTQRLGIEFTLQESAKDIHTLASLTNHNMFSPPIRPMLNMNRMPMPINCPFRPPFPPQFPVSPFWPVPFTPRANIPPDATCEKSFKRQPTRVLYEARIILRNAQQVFVGCDHSRKVARNNAASQALHFLKPNLAALEAIVKEEKSKNGSKSGGEENIENSDLGRTTDDLKAVITTNRNGKVKSSISQIHECALQMRMDVEFSVLSEEGPAHDRHFVVRCKLYSDKEVLVADGEGSNKKLAKQNACSLMLGKLESIESSPIFIASTIFKAQKKNGSSKEAKRKTISKEFKMDPTYGQQINPVSRLIQVMQTRRQAEPKFQLIVERGQSRYKEFVMEVISSDGMRCEGTGPNKRLAKRAAAEAMLAAIGYEKPMPKPGKSLLKKREAVESSEQQVEIGVFNMDDLPSANGNNENSVSSDTANNNQTVSEVNLSVVASMGTQVMAFSGSDKTVRSDSQHGVWSTSAVETSTFNGKDHMSKGKDNGTGTELKRRVTFSNEVSACPAPGDVSYPSASITTLKADTLDAKKPRKKGKSSKRKLTDAEKQAVVKSAREFIEQLVIRTGASGIHGCTAEGNTAMLLKVFEKISLQAPDNASIIDNCANELSAKRKLENVSELYKFTVHYTDFPKAHSTADDQYFSLVSVGVDKPLVCHGSGSTVKNAHEAAALNALIALSKYDQ